MIACRLSFIWRRGQATQPIVRAQGQNQQAHISLERPVCATQAVGRRIARDPGVDDFQAGALLFQLALEECRVGLLLRKAEPRGQAVTQRHDAGRGWPRGRRRHRRCRATSAGGGSTVSARPQAIAASTRRQRGTRANLPYFTCRILAVGGHHRLSAGAGPGESGPGTWPACRRHRRAHPGAQVLGPQAGGPAWPAMHARRSLADGRRRGAGRGDSRQAARFSPRGPPSGALVGHLAASRPHRVRQRRSITRHRAARPRAAACRTGARFRSHRARALRARPLLQAGWRPRDRPRAHRESGAGPPCRGQPPLPRAAPFAFRCRAGAGRAHGRGDVGAAAGRKPRRRRCRRTTCSASSSTTRRTSR